MNAEEEIRHLKQVLGGAPEAGPIDDDLLGWWTPNGNYICAVCASRIFGRGFKLPDGVIAVWEGMYSKPHICCGCNITRKKNGLADYTVTWTIEVTASTAEEAARIAREVQLDPDSLATEFCVTPVGWPEEAVCIDVAGLPKGD